MDDVGHFHLPSGWNRFAGSHRFAIVYYIVWAIIFGSIAILAVLGVIR